MKKLISLLLAAALICALFAGCGVKPAGKALVVCVDTGTTGDRLLSAGGGSKMEEDIRAFASWLDDVSKYRRGGQSVSSEDIRWIFIPSDESMAIERSATLQQIRNEIMSGSGPDVFICSTDRIKTSAEDASGRLFPYVEKSMAAGHFLPLDSFLEKSDLITKDDWWDSVLRGGQDSEGRQVVLPMTFPVAVNEYPLEAAPEDRLAGKSWSDVLQNNGGNMGVQAYWAFSVLDPGQDSGAHTGGFERIFPKLADFQTEELTFTEEELFTYMKQTLDSCRENYTHYAAANVSFSDLTCMRNDMEYRGKQTAYVPMRNLTGGTTAWIDAWCAVNVNTKQPERAFEVIEALLADDYQEGGVLYLDPHGMPLRKTVGSEELPLRKDEQRYYSAQQFQEYQKAAEQIDAVRFPGPLDWVFTEYPAGLTNRLQTRLAEKYNGAEAVTFEDPIIFENGELTDEELSYFVHEAYQRLQQLLAES